MSRREINHKWISNSEENFFLRQFINRKIQCEKIRQGGNSIINGLQFQITFAYNFKCNNFFTQ